jgi:hypothetical protein
MAARTPIMALTAGEQDVVPAADPDLAHDGILSPGTP